MEVACGEHGEAVYKLVTAVNNGKCSNYHQAITQDSIVSMHGNEKVINSLVATSSSTTEPSCGIVTHDSVIVDIDLIKNSSNNNQTNPSKNNANDLQLVAVGPNSSLLDKSSTESVIEARKDAQEKNHIHGFPTSSWTQFWILLKRTFVTIIRDQTLTQMRLVSHVVVGAIIGMIYYGIGNDASKIMSNAGCIFFTTLFTMFTAMMPTILTFPTEMSVFIREHLNYWYSLKAYYFAKTIADLPFQVSYILEFFNFYF
jgi:ABC-2 type transporter